MIGGTAPEQLTITRAGENRLAKRVLEADAPLVRQLAGC